VITYFICNKPEFGCKHVSTDSSKIRATQCTTCVWKHFIKYTVHLSGMGNQSKGYPGRLSKNVVFGTVR
jgi:hypothetical protein